ncbi:hypothetical protein DTO013E5_379 [Penicillium roqueforti]|uniref:Genomic scaffold, ProqFM164S02 n=1 Tax=Penicillium roqueforti (strain FM164) TaxID=1365484 RepID=W6Q504_PENRF|nr:uncharacterized protein LCP9604111_1182 [Penicillium roqueforti]CDM31420.1 unnamed protein product [Penicillium roqueforti FM164]KAF9253656.1 hypothetical protein LCP9604111_1182 [Penicillium roqueforti]KAI1839172.1 hypothetical protein CBS147337_897 [Penicillium roqueforti]KAI2686322.1 hypothetical protein CBS147355_1809 [Penicillium roqueforti]KAI2691631.1 hypothetical protein LCP963914a_1832 [Penicillium roqueforti]
MGAGGVILRFFNLGLRVLQFLDAAVILGIFSYFLAVLAKNDQHIATWIKAVEGLSGAATAYSLLGVVLTCCLGGVAFFAFLGVALDICFVGAMIAIAIMTRKGVDKCTGTLDTPMGTGNADDSTVSASLKFSMACKLEKVVFAVAIIGIFFYLISILFQILLARHHKREKRFGPSPTNGYTNGSRKAFWRRNKNSPMATGAADTLPGHPTPYDVEMGTEPHNEKTWFNSWNKNKNTTNPPTAAPAAGGYGYGNSAYTGNI